MNQAGDGVPVLRLHDHHVAPLAVGDDLFLEVLGGVAATQEAFQGRPELAALAAQPVADLPQGRTGVVGHFAGAVDCLAHGAGLGREGGQAVGQGAQAGQGLPRLAADDRPHLVDRVERVGQPQ